MPLLRFFLFLVLTLAIWLVSFGFARKRLPGRLSEHLAWGFAGVVLFSVVEALLLGLFWRAYQFGLILALEIALLTASLPLLRHPIREGLLELWTTGQDALKSRAFIPAAGILLASAVWFAALAFTFEAPVPGVDALDYHLPIATFMVQEGKLEQWPTRNGHAWEFPKNGNFVFARSLAFVRSEVPWRYIQWFAGITAALVLYGWMRNWGAPRRIAATLAPLFLLVPAVMVQVMALWGTVDLLFHALVLLAWGMAAWMPRDRTQALWRVLFTFLACSLAIGAKSQGLVLGAFPAVIAFAHFLLLRPGAKAITQAVVAGLLLLLLFGSYQYLLNWKWTGNPVSPIPVRIGDRVLFPGSENLESVHDLVETKRYTGERRNRKALIESWKAVWARDWVPDEKRVGGWGPVWLALLLPGWLAGAGVLAWRRQWAAVILGIVAAILMVNLPGSWWSRFSLYLFGVALVFTAAALAELSTRPRFVKVTSALLLLLLLLSAITAAESYWQYRRTYKPADMAGDPGHWPHSLDTYRSYSEWEDEHDRALYRWAHSMEPGTTLVYFHPYWWGIHHDLLHRPDFANRVYGYGDITDPQELRALLAKHDADYFLAQTYMDMFPIAQQVGQEVFRSGKYVIFQAPKP